MFSLSSLVVYLAGKTRLLPHGNRPLFIPHNRSHTIPIQLLGMVRSFVPPLSNDFHKGMMGRIGIIGGCREYTGAPYYAAISALKVGCDVSYVFCTDGAATAIKSYSPELIVLPYLDSASAGQEIGSWIERLHVLVIGPGLGRDRQILNNTKDIVLRAKKQDLPLVIDADGLHMITEDPSIITGYRKAILTPNKVEFERLFEKMVGHKPHGDDMVGNVNILSRKMGNVTIVQKGEDDIISDGDNALVCTAEGSPRRCGGQGDLLSGVLGTFTHWAHRATDSSVENATFQAYGPTICAAYSACLLTKQCNSQAFQIHQRSTTTPDMINQIQRAFESLFI